VRLAVDAAHGVTHIAEGLHGTIARLAPPVGESQPRPARGIAGFVYRAVRGTSSLAGAGLDAALAGVQALLPGGTAITLPGSPAARLAVLSALNGVVGDHLARTGNALAIPMELQARGPATSRIVLLLHGLCMNDQQWLRDGHNHGDALAQSLHATAVYVRYNSGRHVSQNAAELAAQLEALVANWPTAVEGVTIVGHSMGGLVARSAIHQAQLAGMAWPALLKHLVFLGTPHHGAPLERVGNWVQRILGASPYLAPFALLARMRSDGITDLRHGNLLAADWEAGAYAQGDTRTPVPLPPGVACFAVAATRSTDGDTASGDGLVSVASALGQHADPVHDLRLPHAHTCVARGVDHFALLGDPGVARQLQEWLR
jgi:pimeloyl-ACP methyl ester carboxylesterase